MLYKQTISKKQTENDALIAALLKQRIKPSTLELQISLILFFEAVDKMDQTYSKFKF